MATIPKIIDFAVNLKNKNPQAMKNLIGSFSLFDTAIKAATTSLKAIPIAIGLSMVGMIKLDNDLKRAQFRYKSVSEELNSFKDNLLSTASNSSVAADVLWKVAMGLKEAGMNSSFSDKNILKLSATVYKFSEVTGTSLEVLTGMVSELSKFGISAEPVLKTMADLRSRFNLTQKEMEAIIKSSQDAIISMNLYGSTLDVSGVKLAKFTAKISNFQAALYDAKLSIETVTALTERMTDPEKFMENFAGMTMLGVSIRDVTDAMEGNFLGSEKVIRSMAHYGRLVKQSPLLAGTYAKLLGVSAKQLLLVAKNEERMIANTRNAQGRKTLTEMWEKMGNGIERVYRTIVRISTIMLTTFKPLSDLLGKVFELMSAKFEVFVDVFEKLMGNQLVAIPTSIALLIGAFMMFGGVLASIGASMWKVTRGMYEFITATRGAELAEGGLAVSAGITKAALFDQASIMKQKGLIANNFSSNISTH